MNVDKTQEAVNHPDHYNLGGVEVIDAVEAWGFGEGFNRGNAIKYIARAGRKDPGTEIEDLKKAEWYIHREVKRLSGEDEAEDQRQHGLWKPMNGDFERAYTNQFLCTVCKRYTYLHTFQRECEYDYCPYCGAKMDLEEEHGSEYKD